MCEYDYFVASEVLYNIIKYESPICAIQTSDYVIKINTCSF
jgi:hypothetical protein